MGKCWLQLEPSNEKLIGQLRVTPCKANDQAQILEKHIRDIFMNSLIQSLLISHTQ